MAGYATGGEYVAAMQNVSLCLHDPGLKIGTPELDAMGLPRAISGNNASVFRIFTPDGKTWAVKCFTRDVPDRDRRYGAISEELVRLHRPWQVDFQYQPDGILAGGKPCPIVKMEWINAQGLIPWIQANLWDSSRLAWLADSWASFAADLDSCGISHGDLQHGNVLITPTGQLKVIDYDGMFVPGIEALGATEKGHRNYQPPHESSNSVLTSIAFLPGSFGRRLSHCQSIRIFGTRCIRKVTKSSSLAKQTSTPYRCHQHLRHCALLVRNSSDNLPIF